MNENEYLILQMHPLAMHLGGDEPSSPSRPTLPIIGQPPSSGGGQSARGPHRLGSVMTCKKQWALRYIYRVTGRDQKPWTLEGTLIHQALAYHYASRLPVDRQPDWFHQETLEDSLYRIGEGHPADVRTALELYRWYQDIYGGESTNPIAVEHEFRITLGELDPDGESDDAIHYVSTDGKRSFHAPALNDEVVTCRTDLVVEENGVLWIWDHKTKALDWRSDKLPKWNDHGEYSLNLQVLVNMHLVRQHYGVDRVAGMKIHRVSRDRPFQRDLHELVIPGRAYAETPRVLRDAVRIEREVGLSIAKGGKAPPNYNVCFAKYGESDYASACDYVALCRSNTDNEARDRLAKDFRSL